MFDRFNEISEHLSTLAVNLRKMLACFRALNECKLIGVILLRLFQASRGIYTCFDSFHAWLVLQTFIFDLSDDRKVVSFRLGFIFILAFFAFLLII
jgi:hypothetical protein